MYIISKFKDYYDGAVGMGIDKSIVYKRNESEIDTPDYIKNVISVNEKYDWGEKFTTDYGYNIPDGKFNSTIIHIGFCGKLYLGFKFSKKSDTHRLNYSYDTEIIYDIEEAKKRLELETVINRWSRNKKTKRDLLEDYLFKLNSVDPTEWFRNFNTPIFAIGCDVKTEAKDIFYNSQSIKTTINPILKNYEFAKVFDPYTAFQEIQMYISGVLGVDKNVDNPIMSEKQKVAQHGMDKWSFRRLSNK